MASPLNSGGLTIKQKIFCENYVKHKNGTRAAKEAGYSENAAKQIAAENMTKPAVRTYIEKRMADAIAKIGVTKDWRLELLRKTAEAAFKGETNKDGVVDFQGVKSMVSEINKMAGDYAPVVSNLNVSESNLSEVEEIAKDAEKEINEIKSF